MAITIERKAPERGDRGEHGIGSAPAGQCCCCCCCCLHTVGGVIGAVTAFPKPIQPPAIPPSAIGGPPRPPRYSATGLYWAWSAILSGLFIAWLVGIERKHADTVDGLLMLAICFPGVQVAASLVSVIVIWRSRRDGKSERFAHLGKITLRAVLGALIGGLVMLPLFGMC